MYRAGARVGGQGAYRGGAGGYGYRAVGGTYYRERRLALVLALDWPWLTDWPSPGYPWLDHLRLSSHRILPDSARVPSLYV